MNHIYLVFLFVITHLACPTALSTTPSPSNSYPDFFRIEGVYKIETSYHRQDGGVEPARFDQLILFKNPNAETFTLALSISRLDIPVMTFGETTVSIEDGYATMHSESTLPNGIYGEIQLRIRLEDSTVTGSLTTSTADGYKTIVGAADYNLNMCLYNPDSEFNFPPLSELLGEYVDEEGNLGVLRQYKSGAITFVVRLSLSDGTFIDAPHNRGSYVQDLGLVSFPWSTDHVRGKMNLTYRLDDQGRPYLKMFSMSTGGWKKIRKFYYQNPVLPLP